MVDNEIATMATKHRDLLVKLHTKIQKYKKCQLKNKQYLKHLSQFVNYLKQEEGIWSDHSREFDLAVEKLDEEQNKLISYNIEDLAQSESSADNLKENICKVISALKIKAPSIEDSLMTTVVSAYMVN